MNHTPSLKAIQTFEVTARHLSFSLAANELCISQSAVSHQIKSLEQALGKPLFFRTGNQVSLTCYGDSLYSVASDALRRINAITHNLAEQNSLTLNVIAQSAIAVDWLAPRIAQFNQQHPDTDVSLSLAVNDVDFDAADYDIIIGSWPVPANFSTRLIRHERWYPVCTPELYKKLDPDNPASLLTQTLFSSENGQDWELWMQNHRLSAPGPTSITRFSNTILAAKAALSGLGIALSCDFIVEDMVRQGRLVALRSLAYELPWGHFSVHHRSGSHMKEQIETFMDWLNGQTKMTANQ